MGLWCVRFPIDAELAAHIQLPDFDPAQAVVEAKLQQGS